MIIKKIIVFKVDAGATFSHHCREAHCICGNWPSSWVGSQQGVIPLSLLQQRLMLADFIWMRFGVTAYCTHVAAVATPWAPPETPHVDALKLLSVSSCFHLQFPLLVGTVDCKNSRPKEAPDRLHTQHRAPRWSAGL